jgi:tetraacyldisaccharide 4'-kinase
MNARSLLAPLTPLYRAGLVLRERRLSSGREPVRRLRYPVVSIGNLSTGGTGKTPFTIALARALSVRGYSVNVLSRGYGRHSKESLRVRSDGSAAEYGDEPVLIARSAGVPVYVAAGRYEAGLLAEASGTTGRRTVHILDDGFQHRQLHRDVDIVVLNRADWHDRLLPAGNLREPQEALRRADVIAIPADEAELENELRAWGWDGPVWGLCRSMDVPMIEGSAVAFCGIARPQQFFAGLAAAGLTLADAHAYPDHHRFTRHDLDHMVRLARKSGATALITTEKDEVRLGNVLPAIPLKTARLRIQIEDEPAAMEWLINRITPEQRQVR